MGTKLGTGEGRETMDDSRKLASDGWIATVVLKHATALTSLSSLAPAASDAAVTVVEREREVFGRLPAGRRSAIIEGKKDVDGLQTRLRVIYFCLIYLSLFYINVNARLDLLHSFPCCRPCVVGQQPTLTQTASPALASRSGYPH